MRFFKLFLAFVSVCLILFGILYNIFILPFSSPKFDLISIGLIGVGFLIALIIGGEK